MWKWIHHLLHHNCFKLFFFSKYLYSLWTGQGIASCSGYRTLLVQKYESFDLQGKNFLKRDRPGQHSTDHLKERGVEKGSGRRSTFWGRQRSMFNQTNICSVSRGAFRRLLRDGAEHVWAFPRATTPSWAETGNSAAQVMSMYMPLGGHLERMDDEDDDVDIVQSTLSRCCCNFHGDGDVIRRRRCWRRSVSFALSDPVDVVALVFRCEQLDDERDMRSPIQHFHSSLVSILTVSTMEMTVSTMEMTVSTMEMTVSTMEMTVSTMEMTVSTTEMTV